MDITLGCLLHAGAVCLPAARAYGDHCAKVSWITTLASLDKASCGHLNVLATRSVVVAIANEAIVVYRWMQKANNVLLHDFWGATQPRCRGGVPLGGSGPEGEGEDSGGGSEDQRAGGGKQRHGVTLRSLGASF